MSLGIDKHAISQPASDEAVLPRKDQISIGVETGLSIIRRFSIEPLNQALKCQLGACEIIAWYNNDYPTPLASVRGIFAHVC